MASEKVVERYLCKCVKEKKGQAYKFVSPNRINVPDRIILLPLPKYLQKEVAKYFMFIECKSSDGPLREGQKREHKRIRKLGYRVEVFNSKEQSDGI
jgi:hypothetical protein